MTNWGLWRQMKKRFIDCIDIVGASCKSFEGTKQYISTGAVQNGEIDKSQVEIVDYATKPSRANVQVKSGDVLFAKMQATVKVLPINEILADNIYSTGFFAIRAKEEILNSRCLTHILKSESFNCAKDKECKGATQKALNNDGLANISINIPDENQERIADELDQIEAAITALKRKYKLYDELVKARFVEMFGDPITNDKQWPTATVGEIATDVKYGTSRPATKGGKYPYIRMNNLTYDGYLDLTDLKYIDIPDNEYEKCVVRKGDILFNRTNSVDLIGKTVAYDRPDEMIIAGYIIRVRLNERLLPEVFSQYMNLEVMKKTLSSMAKGAVHQANINAQELKNIAIYLPETDLQMEFVEFKRQIDKSKFVESLHLAKRKNGQYNKIGFLETNYMKSSEN